MNHYPDTVWSKYPSAPWNERIVSMTIFDPMKDGRCYFCDDENVEINENRCCEKCFEPKEIER